MKSLIVVFTVTVLSTGHFLVTDATDNVPIPLPPGNECVDPNGHDDIGLALRKFLKLVPWGKTTILVLTALSENPEVRTAMAYVTSPDFVEIVKTMDNTPEYNAILTFFCDQLHFDVYYYLNALSSLLGYPKVTPAPPQARQRRSSKTLKDFLQDLGKILPLDEFKKTYDDLMQNDEAFKRAMEKISSEEFRRVGDAIQALPQYKELMQKLRDLNIPADDILNAIEDFFHWRH